MKLFIHCIGGEDCDPVNGCDFYTDPNDLFEQLADHPDAPHGKKWAEWTERIRLGEDRDEFELGEERIVVREI